MKGRVSGSKFLGLLKSPLAPLDSDFPHPFSIFADWIAFAGLIVSSVAIFALPWINISFSAFGRKVASEDFGLFESPWAWTMVAVIVAVICGIWFVQTRGYLTSAAGVYCLVFNVVFYIGAWKKINAIIGDIVGLARSIPVLGESISSFVESVMKESLDVGVALGFWVFLSGGILFLIGGILRVRECKQKATEFE
ncbi:MAG: hypothetical protein PHP64_01630 [Actinomycetota bacterium]|nr:hypothetical protein [Actinomycetota bacterium]